MQRRSSRLKAVAVPPKTAEPAQPPTPKRRRIAKATDNAVVGVPKGGKGSRTSKKRQASEPFSDLPAELLLEIFSMFEPADVLHLYRASKYFHGFLASSSSDYLWQLAYSNLALQAQPPPCPVGVNIRHYTNFLFGRHCMFCASSKAPLVHDSAHVRLCTTCAKRQLISYYKASPPAVVNLCRTFDARRCQALRGPALLKIEYNRISTSMKQAEANGVVALQAFTAAATATKTQHDEFARKLRDWQYAYAAFRRNQEQALRNNRIERIKSRLTAEGYQGIVPFYGSFPLDRIPLANIARELDNEEWTKIRVDVIDALQEHHDSRTETDKTSTYLARVKTLEQSISSILSPMPHILPATWYIADKEPFRNLIKNSYTFHPITLEEYKKHKGALEDIVTTWKSDTDAYLLRLISRANVGTLKSAPVLELATNIFKCHWCSEPVGYPRVLIHYCDGRKKDDAARARNANVQTNLMTDKPQEASVDANPSRKPRGPRLVTSDTVWDKISELTRSGIRAGDENISFDVEASKVARSIVLAAKGNPATITFDDLTKKVVRLQCVPCSKKLQGKRLVMSWTSAIMHHLQQHGDTEPSDGNWKLLVSKEDRTLVTEAEGRMKAKWKPSLMRCIHCNDSLSADFDLHLRNKHSMRVAAKKVATHYDEPFDVSLKGPPYAVKI